MSSSPGTKIKSEGFCSHIRTVISARSETAPPRSLKLRVTYRIGVHIIPVELVVAQKAIRYRVSIA